MIPELLLQSHSPEQTLLLRQKSTETLKDQLDGSEHMQPLYLLLNMTPLVCAGAFLKTKNKICMFLLLILD